MWALSTCGEPDEIKQNAHPKNTTALFREQAVPEIRQIPVTGDGPMHLVLCSDGITDELDPHEIAAMAASGGADQAQGAQALVEQAQAVAMRKYKDKVDDCSVVLLAFKPL